MPLRIPPGRAGRVWLVRRLQVARHGAELLDRKRTALLAEHAHLTAEAAAARVAWEDAARKVARWSTRAAVLDGTGHLELLARHVRGEAVLELEWSNLMGARLPAARTVSVPDPPPLSALGAGSATVVLAGVCREATIAGARLAVAERAQSELAAELARAARRLRALRDRWIPQHEQALQRLDLALDESQREQAVRVRWLTQRAGRQE